MVMPLHTFSLPGVTLQERLVYAIREEAHELSTRLESVHCADVALQLIEQLGVLLDEWRVERIKLIQEYIAAKVRPSRWKIAVRRGQQQRELDLDTSLCVAHALKWLRPTPYGVPDVEQESHTVEHRDHRAYGTVRFVADR